MASCCLSDGVCSVVLRTCATQCVSAHHSDFHIRRETLQNLLSAGHQVPTKPEAKETSASALQKGQPPSRIIRCVTILEGSDPV